MAKYPISMEDFYNLCIITDEGKLKVASGTVVGVPTENTHYYTKTKEVEFDDDNNVMIIIDDSAYTLADVSSITEFWKLLQIINGHIVVTTV